MTINNAMKKYRLPNPTCSEDLEMRWDKVLTFGDKVVMAGGYYNGPGKPCWFGATYEFLTDDHTWKARSGFGQQARSSSRTTGTRSSGRCSSKQ